MDDHMMWHRDIRAVDLLVNGRSPYPISRIVGDEWLHPDGRIEPVRITVAAPKPDTPNPMVVIPRTEYEQLLAETWDCCGSGGDAHAARVLAAYDRDTVYIPVKTVTLRRWHRQATYWANVTGYGRGLAQAIEAVIGPEDGSPIVTEDEP